MHYLLQNTIDRGRKLYLLDYYLSQINGTVVRQTMLAEFEYRAHQASEEGQAHTADTLGDLYREMQVKYWGPRVVFDSERSHHAWSRVPHFFYNYYVYQYATAYSAAVALSRRILAGEEGAVERYLDLLRSGNSRYPVQTLQRAGVDMTRPQPVQDVFVLFDGLMDEIDALVAEEGE
jgi:oligoendopeptidase F